MYKGFVFIVIILLSACAEGRKSDAELKAAVHAYVQTDALVNWHTAADADSEHADVGDQAAVTTCPDDGDLAIPIDDAGIKKVICAHDYPAWGIGAESPGTLSDKGDGTVVDSLTGLAWQKVVDAGTYNWAASKSYCDGLVLAGKSDWRWPTSFELESLVNYASPTSCAVMPAVFGTYPCGTYWAATPFQGGSSYAWNVDFGYGDSYGSYITNKYRVRCVR